MGSAGAAGGVADVLMLGESLLGQPGRGALSCQSLSALRGWERDKKLDEGRRQVEIL